LAHLLASSSSSRIPLADSYRIVVLSTLIELPISKYLLLTILLCYHILLSGYERGRRALQYIVANAAS